MPRQDSIAASIHAQNTAPGPTDAVRPRPSGSVYMGDFRAPALDTVHLAIIGIGERSLAQIEQLVRIPHVELVGLCDLRPEAAEAAAAQVQALCGMRPAIFSGDEAAYLRMLRELRPDAVIISTSWEQHAPMAVAVMEHGAHAFVEVPLATTLEGLWQVVDAAERTRRHCMMLENVNYGRDELMFLNMVRRGLIGELLHGEAAYIHELRQQMLTAGSWRDEHFIARNGNLYPTHGIGPIAQYMNIARGEDTFDRIVSFGSPAAGRELFAREHLPEGHPLCGVRFGCADINTSIIRTRLGRTILVQWDETSPRPYDRKNLIQGTRGTLAGFPTRMAGDFLEATAPPNPNPADGYDRDLHPWWCGQAAVEEMHARWDHPLYKRLGAQAAAIDSRGGMNYLLFSRIIECLHRGEPLDQNVYEGALWSAIAPLSEKSVHEGGTPQLFPDFTRGDRIRTAPLGIVE
ncbi:MAG: Gfo/Idh/MocA family oxidoreductase [Akkermansia muciniphila]|nr:Gfo/Idh/MocA family oxidoreductase [Akkermansia muciniphila]